MKYTLIILLCSTLYANAQIKSTVNVDEMDGKKTVVTEDIRLKSKSGAVMNFSMGLIEGIYIIYVRFSEGNYSDGCYSKRNGEIKIKLSNGEVMDLIQLSDTECGSTGVAYYAPVSREESQLSDWKEIAEENIIEISSNPWELIRVYKTEYYIELTPDMVKKYDNPTNMFVDMYKSVNQAYKYQ